MNLWLSYFVNSENKTTFLNRKESARAAGYKGSSEDAFRAIGTQNYLKLSDKINNWLEDVGLSENALKTKLISLLEAKETKFFQHEGVVSDQREVDALETQRRTLDMAFKIKGSYAPVRNEHAGPKGEPIQVDVKDRVDKFFEDLKQKKPEI